MTVRGCAVLPLNQRELQLLCARQYLLVSVGDGGSMNASSMNISSPCPVSMYPASLSSSSDFGPPTASIAESESSLY